MRNIKSLPDYVVANTLRIVLGAPLATTRGGNPVPIELPGDFLRWAAPRTPTWTAACNSVSPPI